MSDKDIRREQFTALFSMHNLEVDWELLSDNYNDLPDYEWRGFLHSVNVILLTRVRAAKTKVEKN